MGNKYFKFICVILILFGINITGVVASDCDVFQNILPYMSEEFVQEYKSKLNCCDFNKEIIQCENENIVTLKFEYDNYNERNIKDIFNVLSNLQQLKSLTIPKMEPELPSEIGKLSNLVELEISKSNINQLPTEFSNLTNLETLKIEGSVLNEFPNVFNMASIKKLTIVGNIIGDVFKGTTIPKELANMKNLEELYLNGNNFYGYVPIELLELENLKIITLNGNPNLKGYVPPFPNLDRCDFHKTGLCTLKGEKCKAPIQCRKDEIEDGNKNNGNLVPNAYEDKAISKDSEREVKGDTLEYVSSWNVFQKGKYYIKLILEILVMIILTIIGLYIMMWKLKVCGPFYKLLCCLTILSNK